MNTLSTRTRSSIVRRSGQWVYKSQPKYLTDNAIYALRAMYPSGYVPYAEQTSIDIIRMEFVKRTSLTNPDEFLSHYEPLLTAMREAGLRHGDLTEYAVIVRDNKPIIIDWAESRLWDDPRPDKRPEGDAHWLRLTMDKLCEI